MPQATVQYVRSRLRQLGITDIFGMPGDFAFNSFPGRGIGVAILTLIAVGIIVGVALSPNASAGNNGPQDPGVRGGSAGAGGPVSGLDAQSMAFFQAGLATFNEIEGVALGLGPRFNLDNCVGCHAQPAAGGTSPSTNPQIAAATVKGAQNSIPSFISPRGPVREARFLSDGRVHDLFVITGRSDAPGCSITQPDFAGDLSRGNLAFRIPTPVFGAGLVENTPDQNLINDAAALGDQRSALGIS